MPIENLVFSAGGGFPLCAVAGYTIKRVMKIAAIVIGLFVVGNGSIKWMDIENATKITLTDVAGQVVH